MTWLELSAIANKRVMLGLGSLLVCLDKRGLDLPAFHASLRDLEDDAAGAIWPVTHTWKALDLGGGAFFYQIDLINGYQWKFPTPGNYTMKGNIKGPIVPVTGVYVERETSAAYATTAVGGSGPSASDIAAAVVAALGATTIPVNTVQINSKPLTGSGTPADPMRPA